MTDGGFGASQRLKWGFASTPYTNEPVSGDTCVVREYPNSILVAVIDALGHGEEAAATARAAVEVINEFGAEPITTLVERCHERLLRSRGVVMSVASIQPSDHTMLWLGIGNVEAVLVRNSHQSSHQYSHPLGSKGPVVREALAVRGGVIGYQIPALRPAALQLRPGDTLMIATDGVDRGFTAGFPIPVEPYDMAKALLARHAKGTDDALVLVARYLGDNAS